MKSVFEGIKEDICKAIMRTKNFTKLKELINDIPDTYDLEEEK